MLPRTRVLAVLVLCLASIVLWAAPPATAQYLQISDDLCGLSCVDGIAAFDFATLYVLVGLGAADALQSASYRIDGFPQDWIVSVLEVPGHDTTIGNVLQGGGIVSFSGCLPRSPQSGLVHVQTLQIFALSTVADIELTFEAVQAPLNLTDDAPTLDVCVGDATEHLSSASGLFLVNPSVPRDPCIADCWPAPQCHECTVAVQESAWGVIKSMYR